jgi:hypothetical protein
MDVIYIPQDILALICSFTDETTIFNLACSCQRLHQNLNDAKDKILNALYRKEAYAFDALNSIIVDDALINKADTSMRIVQSILSENIGYVEHHHTTSPPTCDRDISKVHTSLFEVPPKGDVVTSIKLKGDVVSLVLGFEGATQLHNHTDISNAMMKILPMDSDGYVEMLSIFCQLSVGFFLTPFTFQQMLIRVSFRGTFHCKVTYMNLDKHHQARLPRGDVCMNIIRTSRIFVEDWTFWRTPSKKVVFFPVAQGTKGIAITITYLDKSVENGKHTIEYIDVLHTDINENQCVHRLPGSKLFATNMIHKKWYNLPFHLKDCWYVPMENYTYHPKYGTIFTIKFRSIPGKIRIEGIYFTNDLVVSKLA